MAGIYIHIPFCAKRCAYCGFFSTSRLSHKERYTAAVCSELQAEREWLGNGKVNTLYLGGGTPSQLHPSRLERIMDAVRNYPGTGSMSELTIECNPDDITPDFVRSISDMGFNRISMGVQSFDDAMLRFLNRRHDSRQAARAIETCRSCGIDNISIDLMYGLPGQTLEMQESDVRQAIQLGVDHLSSYCLSYEPGSPLEKMKESGQVIPASDELCESMFRQLCSMLGEAGFEHYEISNFCREGKRSRHNSSYWNSTPYLGIGAGAHSYNGHIRKWNPDDIDLYMDSMEDGTTCFQSEELTKEDQFNEYIMLGLRTAEGISVDEIYRRFGNSYGQQIERSAMPFISQGKLVNEKGRLRFPEDSLFISDSIISSLFAD